MTSDSTPTDTPRRGPRWTLIGPLIAAALALLVGAALAVALVTPLLQQQREAARRAQVQENLRRLGDAMQAYRQTSQELPAPTVPE